MKFKHLLLPFNVLVLDAINHSSGRSLQTEVRLPTEVLTGQYKYGFDLQLMLKDVRQAKEFLKVQFQQEGNVVLEKDLLLTKWSDSLEQLLATQLEKDLEDAKSGEVNVVLNEFGVPDYTRCVAKYGLEEEQ